MTDTTGRNRAAFTLVEITVALAVVAALSVIVVQCAATSMRDRARIAMHQAAVELAANVLEGARATPWEKLNQAWAAGQTIPAEMHDLLPAGKVTVKLEAGPLPHTKQITAEVSWLSEDGQPTDSVQLTTVLSARAAKQPGGQP